MTCSVSLIPASTMLSNWAARIGLLALCYLALSVVTSAGEPPARPPDNAPLADCIAWFVEHHEARGQHECWLHERCKSEPKEAAAIFERYLHDGSPSVRSAALEQLLWFDPQGHIHDFIDALEQPNDTAVSALMSVKWDASNTDLHVLARERLRHWVAQGPEYAENLGIIGSPEDIPTLQVGLERALQHPFDLGMTELYRSMLRTSQARWSVRDAGPSPVVRAQLSYRRAMARLGDLEQIAFFHNRLQGGDGDAALNLLQDAAYVRRPELADAIIPYLAIGSVPEHAASLRQVVERARYALDLTFPGVRAQHRVSSQSEMEAAFWKQWVPTWVGEHPTEMARVTICGITGTSETAPTGVEPRSPLRIVPRTVAQRSPTPTGIPVERTLDAPSGILLAIFAILVAAFTLFLRLRKLHHR